MRTKTFLMRINSRKKKSILRYNEVTTCNFYRSVSLQIVNKYALCKKNILRYYWLKDQARGFLNIFIFL